ncbi:MAG: hypothetical protein KAU35_00315 [candidate division Zixibacteria bacterium]|nr:hypothetical protein [candidate division Zixibacteria bacterium]
MSESKSTNLWLLLETLARRRTFIVTFVVLVTVAAVIISLVLPKHYQASALLLPPKDISMPIAGVAQISEVVSVTKGLNLPVMVTTSDVYARMLASRRIADRVVGEFNLVERYQSRNADEAYYDLLGRSDFRVTAEGLLRVAVEDRDPQMAADMVNLFVDELDRVNRDIASSRARQNRIFIEQRLNQIKAELDLARSEFQSFQVEHKAVDFDEQTRLAIEQAINLKITLAEIDINLKMLEKKLGRDNTELQERRQHRRIVAGQLEQLERQNEDSSFFSLPVASIPALKGKYEELYSRVRVNEALYETMLEQLEQAKIQENEELPTITVLDRAEPPEIRSRPQRTLIVIGAFGVSLIIAILFAAWLEYLVRLRESSPNDYRRLMLFRDAFLGWLPGLKNTDKRKTGNRVQT